MKRRDVLWSLVGVAGIAEAQTARTRAAMPAAPDAIAALMRAHGLEPLPGEPLQILAFLESVRPRSIPDPRIEPAIHLDPETD